MDEALSLGKGVIPRHDDNDTTNHWRDEGIPPAAMSSFCQICG